MTIALVQHPTLPDWMFHEYEKPDGSRVWICRDAYRHDVPPDEPLFTVKGTQKTATSQQFVIHARKWDQDHGKKHNHKRKQKTT